MGIAIRARIADELLGILTVCDQGSINEILDVLLSLPGIAIVDADAFLDLANDVREDIRQARADGDDERRSYLRGELHGLLQAHDVLAEANAARATK